MADCMTIEDIRHAVELGFDLVSTTLSHNKPAIDTTLDEGPDLPLLRQATADAACGYDAVMHFCKAYLDFSVDKDSNWLVLVRCSPYSDMKTKTDREQMDSMFAQVHRELEEQIQRGIRDGSIVNVDSKATAQVIISLMVGANRTRVLTPYALPELYDETLDFVSRSIRKN